MGSIWLCEEILRLSCQEVLVIPKQHQRPEFLLASYSILCICLSSSFFTVIALILDCIYILNLKLGNTMNPFQSPSCHFRVISDASLSNQHVNFVFQTGLLIVTWVLGSWAYHVPLFVLKLCVWLILINGNGMEFSTVYVISGENILKKD